jgi:glucose-6-phosphate 1-dehydrogenase
MDIVIFGISGNLAERKLIPAIISLHQKGNLPADTRIIGFSRSIKHFDLPFAYEHVGGNYASLSDFEQLKGKLSMKGKQLFYLALPPEASRQTIASVYESGITPDLILIEKPFGTGYEDATDLTTYINHHFSAGVCLKVDHYAGKKELRSTEKENQAEVSEIVCEMFETATVEHRKGFYNEVGELRDVGQNHLLFMLASVLKGALKREDILSHLILDTASSDLVFARYEGNEGKETYFSVPARLESESLRHIKITLRAGKALNQNRAAIIIRYASGIEKEIILSSSPEAYENILLDALQGNLENFLSDQEVLSAWKFIETVEKEKKEIICYPIGYDQRFFNEKDAGKTA